MCGVISGAIGGFGAFACGGNQLSHFLKEDFVLLVSAAALHLVVQLGDDLVLKLELDRAGRNNQYGLIFHFISGCSLSSSLTLSLYPSLALVKGICPGVCLSTLNNSFSAPVLFNLY